MPILLITAIAQEIILNSEYPWLGLIIIIEGFYYLDVFLISDYI